MDTYFPFLVIVLPFLLTLLILLLPSVKSNIKKELYYPMLIGLACLSLIGTLFSLKMNAEFDETKNFSFNGVIQEVYYDKPKEIPNITVKGKEYDLIHLNYSDYDTLRVGDSVVKQKGTLIFRVIKKEKKLINN